MLTQVRRFWRNLRSRWRRGAILVFTFAISLAIGRAIEVVSDQQTIEAALRFQTRWIESLSEFSPWEVFKTYVDKHSERSEGSILVYEFDEWLGREVEVQKRNPRQVSTVFAPAAAFLDTLKAVLSAGGVAGLLQVLLAMFTFCAVNLRLTRGKSILMPISRERHVADAARKNSSDHINVMYNMFFGPPVIAIVAGVLAFALKMVMLGSLFTLSWITSLAAGAAGATGVVGFLWFTLQKLGEKSAEHIVTPKL